MKDIYADRCLRVIGTKPTATLIRARNLVGRFVAISTDPDHGAAEYSAPDAEAVTRHARDANAYIALIPSADDRRVVRSFLAEVLLKIVACIPQKLYKTYGTQIATPSERVAHNFIQNFRGMWFRWSNCRKTRAKTSAKQWNGCMHLIQTLAREIFNRVIFESWIGLDNFEP